MPFRRLVVVGLAIGAVLALLSYGVVLPTGRSTGAARDPPAALGSVRSGTDARMPAGVARPDPRSLPAARSVPSDRGARATAHAAPRGRHDAGAGTAAPAASGTGTPYPSAPAPMGVADLGVNASGPYEYHAASFEGWLNLTSFAAFTPTNISNLSYPAPDWVLVELNTVAVNVTFPGAYNGTFWVQNTLHFNGTTVQPEDEIWNKTNASPALYPSTLQGRGEILDGEVYAAVGASVAVTLPLSLELVTNVSVTGSGQSQLVFSFGWKDAAGQGWSTYDSVLFGGTGEPAQPPSEFLVDGAGPTPQGLYEDAELVLGGNGLGANANVVALNGSAELLRESVAAAAYRPIPAAYDYGPDAAETVLGVAVCYTGTTVHLTAGPSLVYGLWNTSAGRFGPSARPGWIEVQVAVEPVYAIAFATNNSSANYSYAPTNATGELTTDLPVPPAGGVYNFTAWANGNASGYVWVGDNSTAGNPKSLRLASDPSRFDAPVYLLGTADAEAFGGAHLPGTGYSGPGGTLWLNRTDDALAAPFLRVNDYLYPTFPLVAALDVGLSLVANAFNQSPTTFNYTTVTGAVAELPGWTQGYYFYGGIGPFSVENTSIAGVPSASRAARPAYPPASIVFYDLTGGRVANVTATDEAVGVTVDAASSIRVTDLSVTDGGLGLLAVDARHVRVDDAAARGQDAYGVPSTLGEFANGIGLNGSALTMADTASGLVCTGMSDVNLTGLAVESGAEGLLVAASNDALVRNVTVVGGVGSYAGFWMNSSALSFASVDVGGTGLDLWNDSTVTVRYGNASGYGSAVVDSFTNSTGGRFHGVSATDGADALNLSGSRQVNFTGVNASDGSVGVSAVNVSGLSGSGVNATDLSIGVLWDEGSTGTLSDLSAVDLSDGAYIENTTGGVAVRSASASNATLGAAAYFANRSVVRAYPAAAVGLYNDTGGVTLTGITATRYPFAVWSNNSTKVTVSEVTALYGGNAIAFNLTNGSSVGEVFAYGEVLAVVLQNCSGTTVATSTFEYSAGVGVELLNGSRDTVRDDNFVGNNNSSVDGVFNATAAQAIANNTVSPTFEDNFWADLSGSGPYVVNASAPVKDKTPLKAFFSTYLEFVERGLPPGVVWFVAVGPTAYLLNASTLYIPGWTLANGAVSFIVSPVPGFPPTPALGTLPWTGASLTQTIYFGTPPAAPSSGPPVWLVVGLGAAVGAAAVVAVFLWARRRPPSGERYAPGTSDPPWAE